MPQTGADPDDGKVPVTACHTSDPCLLRVPPVTVPYSELQAAEGRSILYIKLQFTGDRKTEFWNGAFSETLPYELKMKLLRARESSRSVAR